ncbi:4F2 cell-surface antigen heavy chain-like [Varroa jacobsoni]|uniref:4F2 cell-surface antigen heavy chain-like n=1 Tax=Varroa jacobsoni TaxID=62625 RepID=UPI000BF72909|nr:4F2 cell-surface antigen heavy chain-like [Varroa jacobsoni]
MQEAKFTPVDSKMIIDRGNTNRASTVGLSKEEVIKFANDPFWVTLRCFLFVLFWIFWVAMLNGAIVIIVFTPKCCKPKELYWYESSPIYTIRVDKFADSNSDGIGDLAGIISKLKYIQDDIFIKAIALEGLLDRNNPTEIKQNLGTLDDFIKLASYIKVIIKVSLAEVVSGSGKPRDLNTAVNYWLKAGVAGFILHEFNPDLAAHQDGFLQWHSVIANHSYAKKQRENAVVLLALSTQNFADLSDTYCRNAHMVLNYEMIRLTATFDSSELKPLLHELTEKNYTSCRNNFVLGTGEVIPLVERFKPRSRAEAMLIFNMLADATPIVYYGDEFGKKDTCGKPKSRELKQMLEPNTGKMDWDYLQPIQQTLFKLFQQLAKLRFQQTSIRRGATVVRNFDSSVLAMARIGQGNPGFLIVSNFRAQATSVNLLTSISAQIPLQGSVVLTSTNSKRSKGSWLNFDDLQLEGEETLVLQFVPK